ncbi:hypothetical protein [uncultured Amnibacterium sp.]|uniref:hypothetical protein n=1 Tax=uncultured Amnibacterium sp. TaxID=1631851 RepID=UPI0035CC6B64
MLAIATGRAAAWKATVGPQTIDALTASDTTQETAGRLRSAGISVSGTPGTSETTASLGEQTLNVLGALTRWLPTEILAGYAGLVTALQPHDATGSSAAVVSMPAWLISLAATVALTIAAVLLDTTGDTSSRVLRIARKTILAVIAFALWSYTIPYSAWALLPHPLNPSANPIALFALLIVTALFTAAAQRIDPPDTTA